jgi:glycine C-acetyltransferase
MKVMGFDTGLSQTPIVPVMLGEAALAQQFSRRLLEEGVFAMSIAYPTVAKGKARIRVMNSAATTTATSRSRWRPSTAWGANWAL